MRPTAPGRAVTHSTTVIIQSMPAPMSRQQIASKPNGMATTPRMPSGITSADTTGMASRLAITPVRRRAVEVISGIRRRREAGDERGKDQADDLPPAPQRHTRAQRSVDLGAPRQAVLIAGDQRERRRERHLEARIRNRFRR